MNSNRTTTGGLRMLGCVLGLLFLALPPALQAQFQSTTEGGTVTITGYTGPGGDVTIPSEIDGLTVTSIGENAFTWDNYLTSITTGWGSTYADRPTALWIPITPSAPSTQADDPLKLVTHSPAPATVRVQRSVNLVDWEDWQTISRDAGPSELQDAEAGTTSWRFYRGIEE